jgi:hypothetical protein
MIVRRNLTILFAVPLFFGMTIAGFFPLHGCHAENTLNRIADEMAEPTPGPAPDRASSGRWGGEGVRMEVTPAAARLEWDCAHGSIEKPLALDEKGHFSVEGVYTRERPGPLRVGGQPPDLRALYSGSVAGETMTLRVTLIASDESIGAFSLAHGEPGRLRKCR